ncbi:hypothetical protein [Roseomonas sp. HF4]|nr:hypothetical protein [Roseomonas sp. HF4]
MPPDLPPIVPHLDHVRFILGLPAVGFLAAPLLILVHDGCGALIAFAAMG